MFHVSDTKTYSFIAAKNLGDAEKILESVEGHIIIGERHERNFSFVHQIRKMEMGNK